MFKIVSFTITSICSIDCDQSYLDVSIRSLIFNSEKLIHCTMKWFSIKGLQQIFMQLSI
jgi:hypothetical protein